MNEHLISKLVRLEARLSKYISFKMKLLMRFKHMDSIEAHSKANKSNYASRLSDKIYKLKDPIRKEITNSLYYIPYDILAGRKRFKIKTIKGDKRNVIEVYTSKDYFDSYLLYEEMSLGELCSFLDLNNISKIILNPETINVCISKTALKEPVAVIINKNKLSLD